MKVGALALVIYCLLVMIVGPWIWSGGAWSWLRYSAPVLGLLQLIWGVRQYRVESQLRRRYVAHKEVGTLCEHCAYRLTSELRCPECGVDVELGARDRWEALEPFLFGRR